MKIKNGWLITKLSCYDKEIKDLTDKEESVWMPFAIRLKDIYAVKIFGGKDNDECNGKALIYMNEDTFVLEETYEELVNYLVEQKLILS